MLVLFVTGDDEDVIIIHEAVGYFVAMLIIIRFYHSFTTKSKHEKIFSWFHSIKEIIHFFKTFFTHKETKFHNPASSIVMSILVFLLISSVISGAITLAGTEEEGVS